MKNMSTPRKRDRIEKSLREAQEARAELDRRIFHLKTLYDVSKDVYSSVETETILKNFLLMTMGNFGVASGFAILTDIESIEIEWLVQVGILDNDSHTFRDVCRRILKNRDLYQSIAEIKAFSSSDTFLSPIVLALPFILDDETIALVGLSPKLAGGEYTQDDKELLYTLLNNLAAAVKNAKSFEKIRRLNKDLEEKNAELTKTLEELRESLRKIEILEKVKANLCKFIPTTVSRLIGESPSGTIPELEERDLSVLFLDIEGYTGLCERLGDGTVHEIIERHFSVFMDAIYRNNGDVNETAGDGLMVLFMHEDPETSALEAVRAALAIKEQTVRIGKQITRLYRPLDVNVGINSGRALVGAAKFESITGSRWTYTARGTLTNVAARICALGSKGSILMSKETADLVKAHCSPTCRGRFKLKNVSEEVEVFEL
ncbi:MAG: adenylate/guanylate cyclase domain-containing protein [Desulfatiglandales bacterium]